jgi:F0F1-type ATP synthase assembly protein I
MFVVIRRAMFTDQSTGSIWAGLTQWRTRQSMTRLRYQQGGGNVPEKIAPRLPRKPSTRRTEHERNGALARENGALREDIETATGSRGQRRVNLIWEVTQSLMASAVILTTCVGIFIGRTINESAIPFPAEWWAIVGLVIGFYFGRTNHQRTGGVAQEPTR